MLKESQTMNIVKTESATEDYKCRRCGYKTTDKSHLLRHLKRKTMCKATLEDISVEDLMQEHGRKYADETYDCDCGKRYNSRQGLYLHKKICTVKVDEIQELKYQLSRQKQEIDELKKAVASSSRGPQINNTNNGTINNIHVHAFTQEDVRYIKEHPNFQKAVIHAVKKKAEGVMYLIEKKHFDPKHPENHTIKKMNKKDPFIRVYDGEKWIVKGQEDALEKVFVGVHNIFSEFVDQYEGDWEEMKKLLDAFMHTVGEPLGWDLNSLNDVYTYQGDMSDEQKREYRKRLFRLGYEYVYTRSKQMFD